MAKRKPLLLIVAAIQGGGKSYLTLKQQLRTAYFAKFRRATLLFDTNDEYGEYEIDGVKHRIEKIPFYGLDPKPQGQKNEVFKPGGLSEKTRSAIIKFGVEGKQNPAVKRIVPKLPNGMPMDGVDVERLIIIALEYYRGGTLLIEDTNLIFGDALPQMLTSKLVNVRHRNCDVILHVQSIGRIVPKLRQNAKVIRLHYQLDAMDDSADKFKSEIEIFYIAEKLIWAEYEKGNIRFNVYIWREIKKIRGAFSPLQFTNAIQAYLNDNPKKLKPYLNRMDTLGKRLFTHETALRAATIELFKKYYGNPLKGLVQPGQAAPAPTQKQTA